MSALVNTDMKEFWNGEGGEKWVRFQESIDAHLLPFGQEAIVAAALGDGESVLDIGCGSGDTTLQLARCVGQDGRVLGVDISEPILELAKNKSISTNQSNVRFEQGDAQIFRFEAESFDVIFSRFGVMFFDDPVAAFKNLHRALKSNGKIAFVCWQSAQNNEWITFPLTVVANHVSLPAPLSEDEPGPMSFATPEKVHRILAAAGFSNIEINAFSEPFTVGNSIEASVAFLTQLSPVGGAIGKSSADDTIKSQITADLLDALVPYDTDYGVIMGAATWIVTANKA